MLWWLELFSFNVYVYSNLTMVVYVLFPVSYCMLMVVFPEMKTKKKKFCNSMPSTVQSEFPVTSLAVLFLRRVMGVGLLIRVWPQGSITIKSGLWQGAFQQHNLYCWSSIFKCYAQLWYASVLSKDKEKRLETWWTERSVQRQQQQTMNSVIRKTDRVTLPAHSNLSELAHQIGDA